MCKRAGCRATSGALAGTVLGIAAADVALIRTGHQTISTMFRTNRWLRAFAVYLAVHLLFDFKHDPLHWLGTRLIPPSDANLR